MQDILARSFIVFVLALYAGVALVFVMVGFRNWIWRPIAGKLFPRQEEESYHRVKSTTREESPS